MVTQRTSRVSDPSNRTQQQIFRLVSFPNKWPCNPFLNENAEFLVHSPCLVDKVFETADYRNQCVDKFLAAVDYLNSTSRVTQDDRYDTACCGFTQWQKCSKDRVSAACGKDAYDAFEQYILNTFGGFNGQICPDDVFAMGSQTCVKALPPAGFKSKGKLSDNPLTQYMSIYFGFLFGKAAN